MARISIALACSHSPYLFAEADEWATARAARDTIPDAYRDDVPLDTVEENIAKQSRCVAALDEMRRRLDEANPDVLIVFGDDQLEQFTFQSFPALAIFTGEEFSGYKISPFYGLPVPGTERKHRPQTEEHWVTVKSRPDLARTLMTGLVRQNFDMTFSDAVTEHGIGHAFTRPFVHLRPAYDIPILPVYINCYYGPQPTGERCYQLGRAIREILDELPDDLNVGVLGSGGLWHTPMVPRAYIEKSFDQGILDAVRSGDARAMANVFDSHDPEFDPADAEQVKRLSAGTNMVLGQGSGTGETRNWVAAAAVVEGTPGEVIDYIELNASPIGAGFACWTPR